jgi:hypothetical protein
MNSDSTRWIEAARRAATELAPAAAPPTRSATSRGDDASVPTEPAPAATVHTWNAHDVWLSRIRRPSDTQASTSANDSVLKRRPDPAQLRD